MFEKEYLSQKMVLFVAMIFILSFTCRSYLSEKNGISSEEGATFAISNTSESLQDSPYNSSVYDAEEFQKNIFEEVYLFSFGNIFGYIRDIANDPENASILAKSRSYSNKNWVDRSYYTNLLHVTKENQFQYETVSQNCALSQRAPLYYYLLHTISSIFGSLHVFRLGFSINMVFLFLSAFVILAIGKKYFHSSWVGLAAALMYTLSLGCFSATICATPYIMVSFFLLVACQIHLSILKEQDLPVYLYEGLVLVNVLGNLTDYSYVLFHLMLGIVFLVALVYLGRAKEILYYLASCFVSLLLTILINPATLLHLCSIGIKGFHQFVYDFTLEVFRTNCGSNLSILSGQLFMHTALLVVLLFLILLVTASFLKEKSFLEHLTRFFTRMRTGDLADLFVPMATILYFFCITFFYMNENYFVLTTLLPFLALIVSYLTFRLCNTAIRSEFNSGIFGITFTCILCLITITTSTPKYLYADASNQTSFAASHGQEYCIFVSSDTLSASDHILELEKYEHSIVLPQKRLRSLRKNRTFLAQDKVIVYLSTTDYVDGVMDRIAKYGKFQIVQQLTDYADDHMNHIYVYQLRKTLESNT